MDCSLPGDHLAAEEEFSSGENTFEENGEIISDSMGTALKDSKQRSVSVLAQKKLLPLKVGSIVLGKVTVVKSSSVGIEIFAGRNGNDRQVVYSSFASLPVRNVASGYVRNLGENFKIGDIVRAKVAMVSPVGIDLRTNEQDLGVIKAFCSKCRQSLNLFGRMLKCTNCGSSESRKISSEYVHP